MKKLIFAFVSLLAFTACGEREYMAYDGLSLGMKASDFVDSLKTRGLVIDSARTGDGITELVKEGNNNYSLAIQSRNDTILVVQETFLASYNDSTRQLWQEKRDFYAEQYGMPQYLNKGEDHKEALWKGDMGRLNVNLINTYTPQLIIYFDTSVEE